MDVDEVLAQLQTVLSQGRVEVFLGSERVGVLRQFDGEWAERDHTVPFTSRLAALRYVARRKVEDPTYCVL